MPNGFAYLVLFSWPLVTVVLFRVLPIPKAIAWTIVGGYLVLPERAGFDFPLLPPIDKVLIPAVSAALMTWITLRDPRTPRPAPLGPGGRWLFRVLLGLLLVTPFVTVLTNSDPVIAGPLYIPGLRFYDAFSMLNGILVMLIPFLLARRFLATEEDHAELLKVLALAGLAYSLPALFEVRMSPQLNTWIYGFFPHSFLQHMRGGGFRPVVFLPHGLWLAIFFAMTILAAAALWRLRRGTAGVLGWLLALLWLLGTLVLSRSLGALLIVLVLLPVVLILRPRAQLLVATLIAGMVLLYPVLRSANVVPVTALLAQVERISPERASSFAFRLENEAILLERAAEKPLAGWGSWGRPRVYDENGRDMSVTDGAWVIVLGGDGWFGYVGRFGLLALPLILFWTRGRRLHPGFASSGLVLVLAANLTDLLPNAGLSPLTWLLAGAVMGRLGAVPSSEAAQAPGTVSKSGRLSAIRRQPRSGLRIARAALRTRH